MQSNRPCVITRGKISNFYLSSYIENTKILSSSTKEQQVDISSIEVKSCKLIWFLFSEMRMMVKKKCNNQTQNVKASVITQMPHKGLWRASKYLKYKYSALLNTMFYSLKANPIIDWVLICYAEISKGTFDSLDSKQSALIICCNRQYLFPKYCTFFFFYWVLCD